MGRSEASKVSGRVPENDAEKSFVRGGSADHAPVRTDCSRRTVIQLGSLAGLAALAGGCAGGGQQHAGGDGVPINWPDPIQKQPVLPPGPRPGPPEISQGPTVPPLVQQPPTPVGPQAGLPSGVIPRTRWTSASLKRPGNVRPMNGTAYITVHHDGMNQFFGDREDDSVRRLSSIQNAHTTRKARTGEYWADIGYHYIIDRGGRVWEGRPIQYQGAHVQDFNEHNIGVMCTGNFMLQYPTKAQTDRLDQFVAQLMRQHRITLRNVRTHQEWNPTECPGRNLQVYMARTRSRGGNMALALAQSDPALLA